MAEFVLVTLRHTPADTVHIHLNTHTHTHAHLKQHSSHRFLSSCISLLFFLSAREGVPPSACTSGSGRWVHGYRSNRVVFTR